MITLSEGSQGKEVEILQAILRSQLAVDYEGKPIEMDGYFGKKTKYAVMEFQSRMKAYEFTNMVVDGVVGNITWGALAGL